MKVSVQKSKKKLITVFSEYIRKRDKGVCYTCGKKDDWKYMQAGHWISSTYSIYRFDEQNVHCQCVGCNVFKKGNMVVYTLKMIEEYGMETIRQMERTKRIPKRFTIKELESLISDYQQKIKEYGR